MILNFFRKNKKLSTELNSPNFQAANQINGRNNLIKKFSQIILAILFVGLAFYVKQETTQIKLIFQVTEERQANVISFLNDIQSQISVLKADHEQQAQSLQASITHLQEIVATQNSLASLAKSAEVQQLIKQFKPLKPANRSAHSLKKNYQKSHRISIALPFHVKSLDRIADQPYVSVEYQHNTLPIRVKDQLAGWEVIDMNITNGKVVWEHLKTHRKITVNALRPLYE